MTGGLQAGLDFRRDDGSSGRDANGERMPARQRPKALRSLITDEERAAHETFIAEMGDEAVWKKLAAN